MKLKVILVLMLVLFLASVAVIDAKSKGGRREIEQFLHQERLIKDNKFSYRRRG